MNPIQNTFIEIIDQILAQFGHIINSESKVMQSELDVLNLVNSPGNNIKTNP